MHGNAFDFVKAAAATDLPNGLVVEIGGRNINGTIRSLFTERPYISIDVVDGPGVDVVADGANFRPPHAASVVVCCEVLEHTPFAAAICQNAYRMLRNGGVFIVTTATDGRAPHSAADGGPLRPGEYYANVDEKTMQQWLRAFDSVAISFNRQTADIYALAVKGKKGK